MRILKFSVNCTSNSASKDCESRSRRYLALLLHIPSHYYYIHNEDWSRILKIFWIMKNSKSVMKISISSHRKCGKFLFKILLEIFTRSRILKIFWKMKNSKSVMKIFISSLKVAYGKFFNFHYFSWVKFLLRVEF